MINIATTSLRKAIRNIDSFLAEVEPKILSLKQIRANLTQLQSGFNLDVTPQRKRKYKKNPVGGGMPKFGKNLQKWLGYSMPELSSLALGGAFYAASNQMLARWARPIHSALAGIPIVGPALPNLVIGMGLNYLSTMAKMPALKNAAKMIGEGLVASSVVGMGVNASQFVPGLQPALMPGGGMPLNLSGVDYTPELMGQYKTADFGEYRQRSADYGAVDYTADTTTMTGVDFTEEMASEYSDADFGHEEEVGLVPEGLS